METLVKTIKKIAIGIAVVLAALAAIGGLVGGGSSKKMLVNDAHEITANFLGCYQRADYDRFDELWRIASPKADEYADVMIMSGACRYIANGTKVEVKLGSFGTNRQCVYLPGDPVSCVITRFMF